MVTTLALVALALLAPATDPHAAALVVTASGPLTVTAAGSPARRVGALDWLPGGSTLDTGGETALVALAGGRRFELGAGARVTVSPDGINLLAGQARELARVAPIPRVARLAASEQPGNRSGAMRVRGRRIRDLYPSADAVALVEATALRFAPTPGIGEYHVEIEDDEGQTVFHVSTRGTEVQVARDVLQPGRRYRWSVRGGSPEGPARGEAEFSTLDADAAAARLKLRESVGSADDATALVMLAEVDRQIGLLAEARRGFASALDRAPSQALRDAVSEIDARLRERDASE